MADTPAVAAQAPAHTAHNLAGWRTNSPLCALRVEGTVPSVKEMWLSRVRIVAVEESGEGRFLPPTVDVKDTVGQMMEMIRWRSRSSRTSGSGSVGEESNGNGGHMRSWRVCTLMSMSWNIIGMSFSREDLLLAPLPLLLPTFTAAAESESSAGVLDILSGWVDVYLSRGGTRGSTGKTMTRGRRGGRRR